MREDEDDSYVDDDDEKEEHSKDEYSSDKDKMSFIRQVCSTFHITFCTFLLYLHSLHPLHSSHVAHLLHLFFQILETKIEKKCFVYPGTNVTCAFCGTMHALSTVQTHYRVGHKDQCMHLEAWNEYKEQNPFLIVNTSKQGVAPGEKKPRNSKNVQKEHKAKKVGRVNGKFKISTEHSASNKIEQSLSKLTKQMENMHKKVSSMEEQMKKLSKPKSIAPKDKTVPDSPCS